MAVRSSKKRQKDAVPGAIAPRVAEMKEGMLQMESFMKEAAGLAAAEVRRVDEIRRGLGEAVAQLEGRLREKEEMLRERSAAGEELETKLSARIRELENQLAQQERLLESRALELKESLAKSQDTRTAVLEAQVREQGERLRQKDAAVRELQESSAAKMRDLEEQIRKGAGLLERRDAEVADLRAKLDGLRPSPEGSVTLAEENVVLLEELAQGPEQESSPGAGAEAKGKIVGPSMREIAVRSGRAIKPEAAPSPKRSRLADLLAPTKKRN